MGEKYGPFVRLWGILPSQMPADGAPTEDIAQFVGSILGEAVPFVGGLPASSAPKNGDGSWKPKGCKAFAHSAAPVHLYERVVSTEDLASVAKENDLPQAKGAKVRAETWTLRRSVHEDVAKPGTASWEEWARYFKEGHAEAEKAFTPSVLSTKIKARWDCNGVEVTLGDDTWEDFSLKLEDLRPRPPRIHRGPNRRRPGGALRRRDEAGRGAARRVHERGEVQGEEGGSGVEWVMGTASDARGVLPAWVQKMAVPGQIAKDVDMFLEWVVKERKKKGSLWSRVCE
ncbi:hypothetical protein PT974_09092 [Cladobotryum mycophilum]|uniref:DUF3074 domain-containing protein n=1 Tax=Cladobotryum mycophilum TaxID=491253 RepID=A0ABR0SFA3_9HYPO